MPSPAMRLRILPRFPTRVEAVEPVVLVKAGGTYTFSWDYRGIAPEAAPDQALYVLLQDGTTGTFYRTALSDLPTGATDWTAIQNRPSQIDGLSTVATTTGALEQTGPGIFAIRVIGGGSGTSLMTFADAVAGYQPLNSRLTSIATSGAVATADIANSAATYAKLQNAAGAGIIGASAAGVFSLITAGTGISISGGQISSSATAATGAVINSIASVFTTGGVAYSTAIPLDNTIPQITEGTEIQTASLTASNASNKIRVRWTGEVSHNTAAGSVIVGLFKDSGANALGANFVTVVSSNYGCPLVVETEFAAGDTSAHTYRVRVGPSSGTAYVNGNSAQLLGGVASCTLVVEEIKT